jgi:hypothetical protein
VRLRNPLLVGTKEAKALLRFFGSILILFGHFLIVGSELVGYHRHNFLVGFLGEAAPPLFVERIYTLLHIASEVLAIEGDVQRESLTAYIEV